MPEQLNTIHEPAQHIVDEYYSDTLFPSDAYIIPNATEEEETEWMRIMIFTNDSTVWC